MNEELGYSAYKISLKYIYIKFVWINFEKWLFISFLILINRQCRNLLWENLFKNVRLWIKINIIKDNIKNITLLHDINPCKKILIRISGTMFKSSKVV